MFVTKPHQDKGPHNELRKLKATLFNTIITDFHTRNQSLSKVIPLGHVHDKNLGLKIFMSWAKNNLDSTFTTLTIMDEGFFEVHFIAEQGQTYTLNHSNHCCGDQTISLST
jgi:hypothetical protein